MLDRLDDVLNLMVDKKYDSADKLLANMLTTEKDADNVEKIKTFRRLIANKILKENNQFRSDAMYYLIAAKEYFKDKSKAEIQKVAFEVGKIAEVTGLDINNIDARVKVDSLGKTISHLQAICYMYAGFKQLDPLLDIGVDFSEEWNMAEMLK